MAEKTNPFVPLIPILFTVLAVGVFVFSPSLDGTAPKSGKLDTGELVTLILGLVAVALFIERAAQVYLGIWRGPGRADLRQKLTTANQQVAETTAALERMAKKETHTNNDKAEIGKYMTSLENQKRHADIQAQALANYRAETARWALTINLILGILVAAVAARSLGPMFDWTGCLDGQTEGCAAVTPSSWFTLVDILITGALLGGGADGLNKIISVFTAYAEEAKSKVQNL